MLLKTITLKYSPALDGFPDDGLRDFLAHHQVFSKRQYFYFYQGVPHLTFVLSYEGRVAGEDPKESAGAERTTAEDWKAQLSEADYTLFNALRSWRNQLCRKEGMPPYLLSTNEQVAEMCRLRPKTLQELGSIRGFGESKVAKYGKAILEIIGANAKATQTVPPATSGGPRDAAPLSSVSGTSASPEETQGDRTGKQ